MGRVARIFTGTALTLGALAIGALAAVWEYERGSAVYTDGASIRRPVAGAPERTVLWQPPRLLSGAGDGESDLYEPEVSADGRVLLFVRGKAGGGADIYVSEAGRDGWTEPRLLEGINSEADDLGPELSADGTTLLFYSDREGGLGGYDIWMARREGDGWGAPENLGPSINTAFNEYSPALTPDGGQLYFASNRPREGDDGGESSGAWPATIRENLTGHDYDLYTARADSGAFDSAAPILALNSPHDEGTPSMSPVGDFLYFSSDRPGGLGGLDLYRSRRLGAEHLAPEALGDPVNSAFNEADPALSMSGFALRFSSDRLPEGSGRSPRYALFETESREVFIERERREIDWASVWATVWPWLLWLLLALLLLLLLLALRQTLRDKRLGLLAKCLLASALVHLIILFLLSLWGVTTSLGELLRKPGGSRVHLVADRGSDALQAQVRGSLTDVALDPRAADALERPLRSNERAAAEPKPLRSAEAVRPEVAVLPAPEEASSTEERASVAIHEPPRSETAPEITAPAPPEAQREDEASTQVRAGTLSPLARPIEVRVEPEPLEVPVAEATPTLPLKPSLVAAPSEASPGASIASATPELSPSESQPTSQVRMPATEVEPAQARAEAAADPVIAAAAPSISVPAPAPTPASRLSPTPVASVSPATNRLDVLPETREATPDAPAAVPMRAAELAIAEPSAALDVAVPREARTPATDAESRRDELALPEAAGTVPAVAPASAAASVAVSPGASGAAIPAAVPAPVTGLADPTPRALDGSPADRMDLPAVAAADLPAAGDLGIDIRMPMDREAPAPAYAQRAPELREELVERHGGDPETEKAVAAALAWLAAHQSEDGRWSSRGFDHGCGECGGEPSIDSDVATTALSLLCFLGADHTHMKDGPYRDRVRRALSWLVEQQSEDGDLRRGESLYSQGIAAIALAEAYGMTRDRRLAGPVERAVRFIAASRSRAGGWRYEPGQPGDTSVLGWQVMALTSARRAGIDVPPEAFEAAEAWLDGVSRGSPGLYAYQPGMPPTPTMTAEGLFCRQLLGHGRDEPMMRASAELVDQNPPEWGKRSTTYYWYYATLAMFQHGGIEWRRWNEAVKRELLSHQRDDGAAAGSWDPVDRWAGVGGRVYQTAICTLSLEVYYRYLPLYGGPTEGKEHAGP